MSSYHFTCKEVIRKKFVISILNQRPLPEVRSLLLRRRTEVTIPWNRFSLFSENPLFFQRDSGDSQVHHELKSDSNNLY